MARSRSDHGGNYRQTAHARPLPLPGTNQFRTLSRADQSPLSTGPAPVRPTARRGRRTAPVRSVGRSWIQSLPTRPGTGMTVKAGSTATALSLFVTLNATLASGPDYRPGPATLWLPASPALSG